MYNLIRTKLCPREPISPKNGNERRHTGSGRELRQARAARLCRNGAESAENASRHRTAVFPRQKRLKREDFDGVLKSGRRASSPNFSAILSGDTDGYAVVVPKKTARLSVTRHRIKRQVLEALRALPLPPALVVFPKASVAEMKYQDIKTEIAQLLSKIRK